jgi:hypothetical protein
MIDIFLAILHAVTSPLSDGEALQRTSPTYGAKGLPMSAELAREHVVHARIAAAIIGNGIEADDLLSIAWHESRYDPAVSTSEGPGMWWANDGAGPRAYSRTRWSCGVMTPSPKPTCEPHELEISGGYLAGARHLAVWMRQCKGNRICALNGYAGGKNDRQVPGYKTWQVFAQRASWIRNERARIKKPAREPRPST